jgi:hypothetical protein
MSSTELAGLSRRIRSVRRNLRRQLDGSQGSWSGLSASCVRQALLVYVWSQEKMSRHSLDAAAAYLARSGDCAGGRVGEGCLRCFVCRYFGSVDSSVEHRPTCIGAVPGLWFHYTIPASWLGQVSKCRVWGGPHKAAARQALLFVPDGLLEAVENRLCLPFHGDPPSQRTYLKRFRKA